MSICLSFLKSFSLPKHCHMKLSMPNPLQIKTPNNIISVN